MNNLKGPGLNRVNTEVNLNSFHSGDSIDEMQPMQGQGYQKQNKGSPAPLMRQKSMVQRETKLISAKPKQNERSRFTLSKFLQEVANYSVYEFENFMAIMQTSQGRDKIFAIIQQCGDMFVKCQRHASESSPINLQLLENTKVQRYIESGQPTRRQWLQFKPSSAQINANQSDMMIYLLELQQQQQSIGYNDKPQYHTAKNLVKQIRSGRKVFKLLKFIDEWKELTFQVKNLDWSALKLSWIKLLRPSWLRDRNVNVKVVMANFLLTLTKISSFVYYFLDNLMWVANVGVLSERVFNYEKWKFWKKVFSLVKNYTQLIRAFLLYRINLRKLHKTEQEMRKYSAELCGTQNYNATETMRRYINQHSNVYDQMFVLVRNTIRIMMLNYKLKIVFWKDVFHPILVTFLSIVQNITALFKIWLKKRYNTLSGKTIRVQDYMNLLPRMDQLSKSKMPFELSDKLKQKTDFTSMTKLYQGDYLFDKAVLLEKGHKLQSLLPRMDSCADIPYDTFFINKGLRKRMTVPNLASQADPHYSENSSYHNSLHEDDEEDDDYFSLN